MPLRPSQPLLLFCCILWAALSLCVVRTVRVIKLLRYAQCARSSNLAPRGTLHIPRHFYHTTGTFCFRCPHKREVCRNRALHPKHDVVYLKNPEGEQPLLRLSKHNGSLIMASTDALVQLFSGCGYCKVCFKPFIFPDFVDNQLGTVGETQPCKGRILQQQWLARLLPTSNA